MGDEATTADGQQVATALPPAIDTDAIEHPSGSKPAFVPTERKADKQEAAKPDAATPKPDQNGYQSYVDLSGLPEDVRGPIEARFTHFSRMMKKQDQRYNSQISERDRILTEQSKIIDELQNATGAVVDHLQDKSLTDAENNIMARLAVAHESGDTKGFLDAQKDLARLEAKKIQQEERRNAQKQTPKPKTNGVASPDSVSEIIDNAASSGEFDSEDARAIRAWQSERDANGNDLRPWSKTRAPRGQPPETDARYRRALTISAEIFEDDPDSGNPFAGKTVAEKLAEVDRRMGVKTTGNSQAVLGGGLTMTKKTTKIGLTPYQESLAIRTKFGGPKAKTDSEHLDAMRKQVERYNATKKGART